MLDLNKPLQTRDGRAVRIIATDKKGSNYPLVGLAMQNGVESTEHWSIKGKYWTNADIHSSDLMNVPEKPKSIFINIWSTGQPNLTTSYPTREAADRDATLFTSNEQRRIACIETTWHEGQGL